MIVTFCGHKNIYNQRAQIIELLVPVLEGLIAEGADSFLLGGYGEFDSLAALTVRDLKRTHPELRSTLVLPYLDREYDTHNYDDTVYPPLENVPKRFAISRRNQWMVDQADVVVAYVDHDWGGAAATLRYAERKKKRIISVVPK